MGLYQHKPTGEIKRTVPGRYEDKRVQADPGWEPITDEQLDQIRKGGAADGARAAQPSRGSSKG